ncbi:uncharacterized protein [Ptychodera flava]|uniref:uncharacterized protein isoform X2 n=1 Tax=Ptychodera flava TaxID=63121 RepID=UPI00396A3889
MDACSTLAMTDTAPVSDVGAVSTDHWVQQSGQLSILHAAVETGSVEIVQLLLERGFIPTVKDKAGRSPLDIAKAANLEDMVKVLRSSCEVSDASNTKNSKENMVHKTSADSGVSSSSENTTSSDIRSNGEETATAVPNLSPANMALPVSPAVSMATESAEPDLSVDTSTKDAVFAFLKRRLNNKYWKDFFRALGFPNKDIMELKFHFINISLEECIVQGLQSWDKKNGDMGILFGALCHEDVNQRILVDDLKRRFSKLRPIPIKPIKSQADLQTEARNSAHSMENSNGFNGRHERTPSTRRQGGDHTPSPGFKRKKTGSLFDKLPFRKVSTDDGGQNESKKSKGRRQSIDEGKNLKNRAEEFFGFRRSSHDDKMTGSVSTTNNNGPIDKANLSKISETNIQDSGVESSPLQSPVQYVEADVHTTMITDDSERQSVASTSTRRSSGEMSLVIHESGSEGSSTPRKRSPRSSKKKKEKRSSDKFFHFFESQYS